MGKYIDIGLVILGCTVFLVILSNWYFKFF